MEHIVNQAQRAAREGRIARSRGTERSANPYPPPDARAHRGRSEDQLAARLRACWWMGWDQVDRELREPPRTDSAA